MSIITEDITYLAKMHQLCQAHCILSMILSRADSRERARGKRSVIIAAAALFANQDGGLG
jgi:hypothetical protein